MTPEEAHIEAAKSFYNQLLSDSKQLDNMNYYIDKRFRECDCDVELPNISKELKAGYGLRHQHRAQLIFAILEDWFNTVGSNKNPTVTVREIDIKDRQENGQ